MPDGTRWDLWLPGEVPASTFPLTAKALAEMPIGQEAIDRDGRRHVKTSNDHFDIGTWALVDDEATGDEAEDAKRARAEDLGLLGSASENLMAASSFIESTDWAYRQVINHQQDLMISLAGQLGSIENHRRRVDAELRDSRSILRSARKALEWLEIELDVCMSPTDREVLATAINQIDEAQA